MNCQKANSLISAYLDRELSVEERRQLRLHLLHCYECAEELEDLEKVKAALGYLSVANVPAVIPWLRAQLAATVGIETSPPVLAWQSPWFRRTCAVAALLLLFGLSTVLLMPAQRTTPGADRGSTLPALPETSWVSLDRIIP